MTGWTLRAQYAWRHGAHPLVRWCHRVLDGSRRQVAAVSRTPAGVLTFAYAGVEHGLTTALSTLEVQGTPIAGGPWSRTVAGLPGSGRPALVEPRGADVIVVGCDAALAATLPARASLVLPFRVRLAVRTGDGVDAVRRRVSRRAREQFGHDRRRRRWSIVAEPTEAGFAHFYDRMHVPTMRRRHGERTRSERRDVAHECLFRRGRLFFLMEGDRRVAGALCGWDAGRRTLTLRLLGVLDGADEHYASGAFKAVYHLVLEWAALRAVEWVDFANADPFLAQGVVQWKQRFHPTVSVPESHLGDKRLWLHVARDTPAVRDFLVDNPLVAVAPDGALEAVRFFDRAREPRTDVPVGYPGLSPARDVDLDELLGTGQRSRMATFTMAP